MTFLLGRWKEIERLEERIHHILYVCYGKQQPLANYDNNQKTMSVTVLHLIWT